MLSTRLFPSKVAFEMLDVNKEGVLGKKQAGYNLEGLRFFLPEVQE